MGTQVLVVGLNHATAPLEVRENVALGVHTSKESIPLLSKYVPQGIILSTCNRTEVYVQADCECSERHTVERFLSDIAGIPLTDLSPYLHTYQASEAVRHLFRVAAGLESMIVGEYEVLGQVRRALGEAEIGGEIRMPLLNLFRHAVRAGRRARDETAISRNAVSVSSAAVEMARRVFSDLSTCRALVISAGEAGQLTVKTLIKSGISNPLITSRTYERAQALASAVGGTAIPFHRLEEALRESDIVISCSGSPHFILETSHVTEAMRSRNGNALVLIDIAVPRDIDPEVEHIKNVLLYDINDLEGISEANRLEREKEIDKVAGIVDFETVKFMEWWSGLEAAPTITALLGKAEKIRSAQVAKTLKGMGSISAEDQARIEAMTSSIVRKILHDPIHQLRRPEQQGNYAQLVQELFRLGVEG
jgi:glutamyl-tRNA reductase